MFGSSVIVLKFLNSRPMVSCRWRTKRSFSGSISISKRYYEKMIITKSLKIPSKKMASILFDSFLTVIFFLTFFDFVSRDHASGFFVYFGFSMAARPQKTGYRATKICFIGPGG